MTETPAIYTVDDLTSTAAADQDLALDQNTANAIVAHFAILLAGGMEYVDAVMLATKFSEVLMDQYMDVPEYTLSGIFGGGE